MRYLLLAILLCLGTAAPAGAVQYLGDFADDATVYCFWSTSGTSGASITRATNGTVYVYKDGVTTTEVTTGVTDTEDFDAETGVHLATIATTDAFYATGSEYVVILKDAVIDGQAVSHPLCQFSIERAGGALALIKARTPAVAAGAAGGLLTRVGPTMMGPLVIKKGSTGVIALVKITGVTGAPMTGVLFDTSGLKARYCRADQGNADCADITLATMTRGTWATGGLIENDATDAGGIYQVSLPDAVVAAGADRVKVYLSGVTNMVPTVLPIELVDVVASDLETDIAAVKTDTAATLIDTGTDGVLVANAGKSAVGTYRKNVAGQRTHPVFIRSATNTAVGLPGASVTVTVDKDGAGLGAATGLVTEVGGGWYRFAPSQADLNCDSCIYTATAGSTGIDFGFWILTAP